ncbi:MULTISPECIES: hypothetical protein [Streptomyces]|uniref:Uncharacterized protein n=1 Tax=Streptomyces galilaeus TaxID=33899 RepID=A0ABW9J226_STRGJ|nr:hypothetical protein [Streptomyces galilaeus]GGW76509.1 hypothetical protein GCM10010350_71780 [Streptomyces galilaeus]
MIGQLRQLHEEAEDAHADRMSAGQELFGALLYLETHARALKDMSVRRASAIERVRLWEYLRERVNIHRARAVEDARAANAEWAELAPALAVKAPSAAYNKGLRLRAAAMQNPAQPDRPVRRTPEAVRLAERQAAAKAAAERRAEEEAARRHALMTPVARRLLEHRADLDDDDDVQVESGLRRSRSSVPTGRRRLWELRMLCRALRPARPHPHSRRPLLEQQHPPRRPPYLICTAVDSCAMSVAGRCPV